jgi:hypothetical protein
MAVSGEVFVRYGSQVVSPQRALALSKAMSFEKSKMRARLLACWGMGAGRIVCDGKSQAKIET